MTRLLARVVVFAAAASATITGQTPAPAGSPPPWAYTVNPPPTPRAMPAPVNPEPRQVPGSTVLLTIAQTRDAFNPPDWHPAAHPPMPEAVAHGRRPPSYTVRQLYDLQQGVRQGPWSALMKGAVEKLTVDDMIAIAAYTASREP